MGKHQCTACKRTFRTAQGLGLHFNHARKNPKVCDGQPRIDPRDAINHRHEVAALLAEIERLKAEVAEVRARLEHSYDAAVEDQTQHRRYEGMIARHKRALAAGPAALRRGWLSLCSETAAGVVERAQAEAMEEET